MRRCVGWLLDDDGRNTLRVLGFGRQRTSTRRVRARIESEVVMDTNMRKRGNNKYVREGSLKPRIEGGIFTFEEEGSEAGNWEEWSKLQ
jgi:hypothetical protein